MEKKDRALDCFRQGYNCAQSVLMACSGMSGESARSAAAFGGGMGRLQKTCGAVTGAYIYFGLKEGADGVPDAEVKERVYSLVKTFNRLFTERNGSDNCLELLGQDLNTDEGQARIKELKLQEKVCEKCVADAVEIIGLLTGS